MKKLFWLFKIICSLKTNPETLISSPFEPGEWGFSSKPRKVTEIPDLFDFEFVNIIIIIIFVILPKRLRTTQKTDEDYIYIYLWFWNNNSDFFFQSFVKNVIYNREERRDIGFWNLWIFSILDRVEDCGSIFSYLCTPFSDTFGERKRLFSFYYYILYIQTQKFSY